MNHFDHAAEIAASNESGAARCRLADGVELLVHDRGEGFTVWDYRPRAKRAEKVVSAQWAHRFLSRARDVTVSSFEW
ncbi:MAG: hypothetical protein WCI05_02895 [Myxococcales bacterium]